MISAKVNDLKIGSVEVMPRKRIYNPKTGRYYSIRQRSTKKGKKGEILGLWEPPTKKKTKKSRK